LILPACSLRGCGVAGVLVSADTESPDRVFVAVGVERALAYRRGSERLAGFEQHAPEREGCLADLRTTILALGHGPVRRSVLGQQLAAIEIECARECRRRPVVVACGERGTPFDERAVELHDVDSRAGRK